MAKKKAASDKAPAEKKAKKAPAKPRGPRKPAPKATKALSAGDMVGELPAELAAHVAADGGKLIGHYKEPFGGNTVLLVALPIDKVAPTPWQRDVSPAHVKKLARSIEKVGRFLDPVVAVRQDGRYLVPNGGHRLAALREAGGQSIVALLVPEAEVAHKILALNTEKAHVLKEKALEVVRLARVLIAAGDARPEKALDVELEEGALVTIGMAYEAKPRVAGSSYFSILKKVDALGDAPLKATLPSREAVAKLVVEADELVSKVVDRLKARGFKSPYLKSFVIARLNPLKAGETPATGLELMQKFLANARAFDPEKVREEDMAALAAAGGGGGEEGEGGEG